MDSDYSDDSFHTCPGISGRLISLEISEDDDEGWITVAPLTFIKSGIAALSIAGQLNGTITAVEVTSDQDQADEANETPSAKNVIDASITSVNSIKTEVENDEFHFINKGNGCKKEIRKGKGRNHNEKNIAKDRINNENEDTNQLNISFKSLKIVQGEVEATTPTSRAKLKPLKTPSTTVRNTN